MTTLTNFMNGNSGLMLHILTLHTFKLLVLSSKHLSIRVSLHVQQ